MCVTQTRRWYWVAGLHAVNRALVSPWRVRVGNDFGDAGVASLAAVVRRVPGLTSLNVASEWRHYSGEWQRTRPVVMSVLHSVCGVAAAC